MIVGIDEVGRGCLAGPVCVAAVALPRPIDGVKDSKELTREQRIAFARLIKQEAYVIGIGWSSHQIVDRLGLTVALRQAALQAISAFDSQIEEILLDGNHNYIGDPRVRTIIHGDALEPAISAASVVAKVARDNYMAAMAKRFPAYGFEQHVGYATPGHKLALQSTGPCAIHRLSFMPLRELAGVD